MDREIIKHWVALLEFKASYEEAKNLTFQVDSIGKTLLAVATAMEAAAIGLSAAVLKTASSLTELGHAAERSALTPQQLQGIGYAAKQMGADVDVATNAFRAFNEDLESGRLVQLGARLGIKVLEDDNKTVRDRFQLFKEFAEVINDPKKVAPQNRLSYLREIHFGDPSLRHLLEHPEEFHRFYDEEVKRLKGLGLDLNKATEEAQKLTQEQNRLSTVVNDIWTAVSAHVGPKLTGLIREVREAVEEHAPEIKAMLIFATEGLLDYVVIPMWNVLKWWHHQGNVQILPQLGDGPDNWWDAVIRKAHEFKQTLNDLGKWILEKFVDPVAAAIEKVEKKLREYLNSRPGQVFPGGTSRAPEGGGGAAAPSPSIPGAGAGSSTTPPGATNATPPAGKKSGWEKTKEWYQEHAPSWMPGAGKGGQAPREIPALSPERTNIVGGANLMSGGHYPGAEPGKDLTTITLDSGKKVTVHADAAPSFRGFLNELEKSGYNIDSLGGYSLRSKRGGSTWSEHAFGNAIDINPEKNPFHSSQTNMPSNITERAAKWGLSWGGDWRPRSRDPMHFEWRGVRPWLGKEEQGAAQLRRPSADKFSSPFAGSSSVSKLIDVRDRRSSAPSGNTFSIGQSVNINVSGGDRGPATKNTDMSGPRDQARMHKNLQGSFQ